MARKKIVKKAQDMGEDEASQFRQDLLVRDIDKTLYKTAKKRLNPKQTASRKPGLKRVKPAPAPKKKVDKYGRRVGFKQPVKKPYTAHSAEHSVNPGLGGSHLPGGAGGRGGGPMIRGGSNGASQDIGNMAKTSAEGIPEGLNYMEEQYVKYGHDLGNYKPQPIIGTDMMSSVYHNSETLTPAEYDYFFNWQHPVVPGGKKFARARPKGQNKFYDQTHLHGNILAEHEKSFELTRTHGGVIQNRTRYDEAPVFLSSY